MAISRSLTNAQKRLLWEMALSERAIFIVRHPKRMELRYVLNSFPIRTLQGTMVAKLASQGYLRIDKRGYYVLSVRGQLIASVRDRRRRRR